MIWWIAFAKAEDEVIDDLDFLIEQLSQDITPPNILYGMGTLAGATEKSIWESRLRYRVSDKRLPGFEDSHPHLHDYVEFVNRYYYKVNHPENGWDSNIQIDQVSLGLNKYILDDVLYNSIDLMDNSLFSPVSNTLVRLEKVNFTKQLVNGKLEIGDTGAAFGRGIALNIRSNKLVDIDTSLRGVKYVGNFDNLEITAISGLSNRQQISRDNPNISLYQDVPHMVSAAQLMFFGVGPSQIGVHTVATTFGDVTQRNNPGLFRFEEPLDATITGADIELFGVGGIDWYFEGNHFRYLDELLSDSGKADHGYTGYMSASLYPAWAVILFEAKVAKDSERINRYTSIDNWEVVTPPSLEYERMITEDSSATVNSDDVIGTRLRLDYPLASGMTPYTSLAIFRDRDLQGLHFNSVPETIFHPIAGLQYTEDEKVVLLNAGFRIDQRDQDTVDWGADKLLHLDFEYSIPLFGEEGFEINTSGWKFFWGNNTSEHNDFVTIQNAFVWRHKEFWDFTWYQDYTTNTQLQSRGNITENLYMAGEVKYKPTSDTALKMLFGAYKAGIRCSGGQCRTLPGFEGVEIAYSTNF